MFQKPVQLFLLPAMIFLFAAPVATSAQQRRIRDVSKTVRKYDVIKLNTRSVSSEVRRTGKLVLKTSDRTLELQLVPHDLRSADYRSQVIGSDGLPRPLPRSPVNTYRGFVRQMNGAEVRLTITDESIEGAIITRNDRYFIQPARSLSKRANKDDFVFYNTKDLSDDAEASDAILADQVAVEQDRTKTYLDSVTAGPISSTGIVNTNSRKIVRLATEADAEYVAALGGASQANNHILSIMNQVDGLYSVELGLTFQIVFQNAWTNAATDPYTSLNNVLLLTEFKTYWNANFANVQRDLAHLWSGKDLVTLGTAYLGAVCTNPASAYGFSGRRPADPANPVTVATIGLTAHEIGHNFGAVHPVSPDVPPDIAMDCGRSIMSASYAGTFCTYSRSQIMGFTTQWATCLLDSPTGPPPTPTCGETPIVPGVAASGSLAPTDCRSTTQGTYYFADRYSFDGQAGQRLVITMNVASPGLESFVFLIGPDGFVTALDAGNGGKGSSRIPASGSLTLPLTGKYIIEASSDGVEQTGDYTLNVALDGCVLTVNPTSQHFPASGGSGTINVTAIGTNCASSYEYTVWPIMTGWLKIQSSTPQTLSFTVDANAGPGGREGFLVVGASYGSQMGGLSIPITQSGTTPDCVLTPIAFGETINGNLSSTDCRSPLRGDGALVADRYVFTAKQGQEVVVLASPAGFYRSFLALVGPTGRLILTDELGGGSLYSRIPGGTGMLKLGLAGQYVIELTGGPTGSYSLTLLNNEPPVLLTEENSDNASALESVSLLRDPFPLTAPLNLGLDQQTRITLFADNLALTPGENASAVTAVAEDNHANTYPLTVEFVGKVPGLGRLTQIVCKLPSNLPAGEEVRVSVTLRGTTSNKVRFRIK